MTNIDALCENAGDALGLWNTFYPQRHSTNFVQAKIQFYLPQCLEFGL